MKKYRVLLNIINNFISFFAGYYTNLAIFLSLISLKPKKIEIIFEAKYENIVSIRILKKGLKQNLDNFLAIIQKLSNKKND